MCLYICKYIHTQTWLPRWLNGKESVFNARDARDVDSILGSGRSHGGGHGKPFQDSYLENPMD